MAPVITGQGPFLKSGEGTKNEYVGGHRIQSRPWCRCKSSQLKDSAAFMRFPTGTTPSASGNIYVRPHSPLKAVLKPLKPYKSCKSYKSHTRKN